MLNDRKYNGCRIQGIQNEQVWIMLELRDKGQHLFTKKMENKLSKRLYIYVCCFFKKWNKW